MPLYIWKNKVTGEEIEVVRPIAESDIPPDTESEWEKVMQSVDFRRGDNWRGSKGNW